MMTTQVKSARAFLTMRTRTMACRKNILKLFFDLILLGSLLNVRLANAETRHYKWEVKYEYKSPDCYKKLAITINGETPGPTIYAQQGDIIMLELINSLLTENIAIHWHGIRQIGSPWFDGSDGVSQCPVIPGETFVYTFVVDKAGTYMYHAHYGMQRVEGFYGSILVAAPDGVSEPFSYDYDRSIILIDWYHSNCFEQATKLSSIPFVWVGDPQSILIQGKGMFGCFFPEVESGLCNSTTVECFPYVLPVIYGKTYRLRIGCLTSLLSLSFEIEGHTMTVIEADGNYVEPFIIKNLYIYSGETYSVLIKADQDPSRNYWATAKPIARNSTTPMGLAILSYSTIEPTKVPVTSPPTGPIWNDVDTRLAQSIATKAHRDYNTPPPKTSDRVIVMLNTQNLVNGHYRWSINNVSYTNPHTPYIVALKYNLTSVFDQTPLPENYDSNYDIYSPPTNKNAISRDGLYRLVFNSTVDIVLQNANTMINNNSETHPWHLHGHDFWVIGYGIGKFDINKDPNNYNLVDPVMKNTVVVHPYGWTAIRFLANNPGVWSFHCHIEPHYYMGMGVVFEEGVNMLGELPNSIMGCGVTKGFNRG